ncbi:MAG: hypothetical protein ACRCX2_34400 [Paraclostridium sp.]
MKLELNVKYSTDYLKELKNPVLKINSKVVKLNIKTLLTQTSAPYIEFFISQEGKLVYAGHGDILWN